MSKESCIRKESYIMSSLQRTNKIKKILLPIWPMNKQPKSVCMKCIKNSIIFHQDNVSLHVSSSGRRKLLLLGQKVFPNTPYSLNVVPLIYHLFHSFLFCWWKKVNPLKQFFPVKDKSSRSMELWSCLNK